MATIRYSMNVKKHCNPDYGNFCPYYFNDDDDLMCGKFGKDLKIESNTDEFLVKRCSACIKKLGR